MNSGISSTSAGAWDSLMRLAREGAMRPFCRALQGVGGMTGAFGLDEPVKRPWIERDWRLGAYTTSAADHLGVEHNPLPWHTTPAGVPKEAAEAVAQLFEVARNASDVAMGRDEL